MRQIFPDAGPDLPVTAVTSDVPAPPGVAALADLYAYPDARGEPARPWVRANMISSADGAATLDGRSGGLSGPADRMVFAVLRSLADDELKSVALLRMEGHTVEEIAVQLKCVARSVKRKLQLIRNIWEKEMAP